jgi:GTP-binding protein
MHILLTKADKLTHGAGKNTLLKVQSEIRKGWGDSATIRCSRRPSAWEAGRPRPRAGGLMELEDKPVA